MIGPAQVKHLFDHLGRRGVGVGYGPSFPGGEARFASLQVSGTPTIKAGAGQRRFAFLLVFVLAFLPTSGDRVQISWPNSRRVAWAVLLSMGLGVSIIAPPTGRAEDVPASARKLALVIGNDAYANVPRLANAVSDSRAIAEELRGLGFKVMAFEDLNRDAMNDAITNFIDRLKGNVGFFYFSGHGMQIKNENFLLPTDIRALREQHIVDNAISLSALTERIGEAKAELAVLIIDACRDNPFRTLAVRGVGSARGLARAADPPLGSHGFIIVFSAGANQQALDRLGPNDRDPNGLFVRELLPAMRQPGLSIHEIVYRARDSVAIKAKQVDHDQTPAIYDQFIGKFYLIPPSQTASLPALPPPVVPPVKPEVVAPPPGSPVLVLEPLDRQPMRVTAKAANLREAPTVNSKRVLELTFDTAVTAIGKVAVRDQMWFKVLAPEATEGFVLGSLLRDDVRPAPIPMPDVQSKNASVTVTTVYQGPFAPGTRFKDCPDCPAMVVAPAGTYTMGDDFNVPKHSVNVPAFAIGQFEVTFDEFDACVRAQGCRHNPSDKGWGRGRQPVIDVSYEDAKEYADWLSALTSLSYRLPSEAEWEYAARAGSDKRFHTGVDFPSKAGNCSNCGSQWDGKQPAPVGSFKPNAFGLYDAHGNVWELTADCYNSSYDKAPADGSAWTGGDCAYRMRRGGSWYDYQTYSRSAYRYYLGTGERDNRTGFRVVRELPKQGLSTAQ